MNKNDNSLKKLDLEKLKKLKKVHFIGISSPFGSFCAQALINLGITITASELNQDNAQAKYWIDKGSPMECLVEADPRCPNCHCNYYDCNCEHYLIKKDTVWVYQILSA